MGVVRAGITVNDEVGIRIWVVVRLGVRLGMEVE